MKAASFILALIAIATANIQADEKLKDIACRSVHLQYSAPEGSAFYNEVKVEQSAPGTYFCVCGFNKGYFGIQEKGDGKKVVIFSVWDPAAGDDPKQVPESKRVKLLHQGSDVRIGRFGNEGTGGQSFFDFDWKPEQTHRFLVTARPDGSERTAYSGYFYLPEQKAWKHLVTFSTLSEGKQLGGYYSFVEDFKRDRVSATKERRASFGNGWVKPLKGELVPLLTAKFTADKNPVFNIDAGQLGPSYFLVTGGMTENKTTKLGNTIERKPKPEQPPEDLPRDGK